MINATAAALTKGDVGGYEAVTPTNRDAARGPVDGQNAMIQGQPIDNLGPGPLWHQRGSSSATTARALAKNTPYDRRR